jgi:cell division septum initiation protein DivIVA
MLDYLPGETVGQHYNRMVAYARTLDPRFIGGAASVREIARVEQAIATLKRQAEEKAQRESDNDPHVIEAKNIAALWYRANDARMAIAAIQAQRKKSSEFEIFDLPDEFFEAPQDIGGGPEAFKTFEEAEKTAAALVGLSSSMSDFFKGWDGGTESRNEMFIRVLVKRVLALEERLK